MNPVHALVGVVVASDVWDGLREGFFMFWETFWALVLGFGLSGAVQAFVSKDAMQRVLGDHRAPAVARSSLFGMASSSCSYAAAAMARSLVRKGADVRMLWKELLIGYTIAGLLSALVPVHVWNDLFLQGHGFLTTLENVIIGPFIAIIAFVCSVGNVAMAAALWRGGIGFGGVISFIFADLIALPLLLVYRKYYGAASMWRMLATFWALMSTAGLVVEGIFQLFGAVPDRTAVPEVMTTFHWNYTTVLNIVAVVAAAVLLRLYSVKREPVSA